MDAARALLDSLMGASRNREAKDGPSEESPGQLRGAVGAKEESTPKQYPESTFPRGERRFRDLETLLGVRSKLSNSRFLKKGRVPGLP